MDDQLSAAQQRAKEDALLAQHQAMIAASANYGVGSTGPGQSGDFVLDVSTGQRTPVQASPDAAPAAAVDSSNKRKGA